jgi:hypothetical protein
LKEFAMDSLIEVVVTEKVLFLPRRTIGVKLVLEG